MTFLARAVLAVLLLLGVHVLAIGLLVALGLGLWQAVAIGAGGWALFKLTVLALGIGVPVVTALWKVAHTREEPPSGLALTEADHPALWAETRSIAQAVGTRAPDEIRLLAEVNASVQEESRMLGLVGGRRVMTLGTPLLLGLTRQQLRSVLAHELGHYSHRHTSLSPAVYRGQLTVGHLVDSLGEDTWTGKLFAAYGALYLRVSTAVARRQELEADAWSHRIAGRDAAASAMRELPALDGLWQFFLQHYAFAVDGTRPDALHVGFERVLDDPHRQSQMVRFRDELPDAEPGPYDTHPSTRSRVAHFEGLPDDGLVDDGTPARMLVSDTAGTWLRLEAELFADSPLTAQSWEWLAHESGSRRSREGAAMLVRASRERGSGAETLRDAVVGLSLGRARNLVRPYVDLDTPPEQVDLVAQRMVNDLVALALVDHCGARFGIEWDGAVTVIGSDGAPVDVVGLVAGTVAERSATWLLDALEQEGVPSAYSIDLTALGDQEEAEQGPAMLAVAVCEKMFRMRTVVVTDVGLLVKRIGFVESLRRVERVTRDPYRNALHHVSSLSVEQLLVDRRVEAFAWNRVHGVRLGRRRRLRLSLDGRRRDLRIRKGCVAGDLAGSLHDHIPDRLVLS